MPPRAAATPYHHGDLRAAMLEAAQRILESEGIEGLTLRAAARAAGVSHAAPKNHFGDLSGLLSELAAIGFRRFTSELKAAMEKMPSGSAEERLDAMGAAYVGFAKAHPGMFVLMFRGERLDLQRPALRQAVDEAQAALASSMAARLGIDAAATGHGSVTPEQGAAMVRAWSLVHGFSMLLIDGRLDRVLAQMPPGSDWRTLLARTFSVGSHPR
ncbi:TetR/AcrR family transcriptional regulator [Variovorax sp. dw_308]|uniref:TetR/AcrR family transcriptional regulator n=1 Tax=Variovorax sp. dw_308 TaxID=2721546 RepID=UPI001C4618BB|nr:TetR-like C-terminal domain-containing protein [Variovorax sp. dw_308]